MRKVDEINGVKQLLHLYNVTVTMQYPKLRLDSTITLGLESHIKPKKSSKILLISSCRGSALFIVHIYKKCPDESEMNFSQQMVKRARVQVLYWSSNGMIHACYAGRGVE